MPSSIAASPQFPHQNPTRFRNTNESDTAVMGCQQARSGVFGRRTCAVDGAARTGFLLRLDLKYLYCWPKTSGEYAYAAIDDFSREAVARIRPQRTSADAVRFPEDVLSQLPYRIEAVMTDNDLIFAMRYAFQSQTADALPTGLP